MTTADTNATPAQRRRWPRRLAIGVAVTGALLGGAIWLLGRESTLQTLVRKVASASGGSIVVSGVSGSLYGSMHVGHVVFRSPVQVITGDNIDIDWSPLQYMSSGIAISKLYIAGLRIEALRPSEPAPMPASLAPPFRLAIGDARIATVTFASAGAATVVRDVRFKLQGDQQQWTLRDASAATPWGQAAASGSIGSRKPFKLDAGASLVESQPKAGQKPARLDLRVGGDLVATQLDATGQSGKATGAASFTLAPYDPVPLRALTLKGHNIDPGFFNPALPTADLTLDASARVDAARNVAGSVMLTNQGALGPIDQQRLPLRAMSGQLTGTLSALQVGGVLIDLGAAGKFTGSGSVQRSAADKGIGAAAFALHTDRLDLKALHSHMKATRIAGDIRLANAGTTQTLDARLVDSGMRLDAEATLDNTMLQLKQARLAAGSSSVRMSGSADLAGKRPFKLTADAEHFNPASFGDYPAADLNAAVHAAGELAPQWKAAADFVLRPSRLSGQPLSGKGKLNADAAHVSGVEATLALGENTAEVHGSFGAPGERLLWRMDGRQLALARSDLYGVVTANGVVSGTMAAPRTSFEFDAKGLGWAKAARAADTSVLHASGEAWLAAAGPGAQKRSIEIKAAGNAQRFNPAAFGSPLAGSINGNFDASGRLGPDWRGALNLALQPSTLSNSPLFGYAKLAADAQHVSNADVDLHVGPNILNARGSFGAPRDRLDWRIDAPQLAALGPDFAGVLRGSGTLAGAVQAPAVQASLEGQKLKLFGQHQLQALRASASLGNDALVSDIELTNYANGERKIASARLQTTGTRGAHTLHLTARNDDFNALADVRGGWNGSAWNGTVNALQNSGRYAFTLQAPAPLRLAVAPGAGVFGLLRPAQLSTSGAVIKLPAGSVSLQTLAKDGAHWRSKGVATGVPLTYVAQFSPAVRENLSGDLTLGADWSLDMQAAAAAGASPALAGGLHVFRERGDLVAGSSMPVVLGLRLLDARADVSNGALRMQVEVDGTRAGHARVDATAQLLQGRVGNDSPLKLSANADMGSIAWLAPLSGQPELELDGALKFALTGAGTIGAPSLNGSVSGDKLAVRWPGQGVKLRNGELRALLAGDQLQLQRLAFDGNQGHATADGLVRFAHGEASMQLKLVADKLEILSRPDRTVVVSGSSTLTRDEKRFALEGKFRVDRALLELAPQGRPTLSDDVIVLGRGGVAPAPKQAPSLPLAVNLEADLGDAFRLRGMGLDAELNGTLRVRSAGGRAPRVNGTVRVANGTYAAYGQKLAIERGVITFSGPFDNPSLNVLALRKRPDGEALSETNVEAGVEVHGTAMAPVAKLVSTPSVPDSDKLAWLVLGHGMENTSGNEAGMLGAAAAALLGGSGGSGGGLAGKLGVDELGVAQAKGLETTVVTIGKRISSRAYLSFEQGASTATSLVKLRYKLNPRITLQFQTGTNTALDVLYSWAFD